MDYADLEIRIRHREASTYEVELQLDLPGVDETVDTLGSMEIEVDAFREIARDDDYGEAMGLALFNDDKVRTAYDDALNEAAKNEVGLRVRLRIYPSATELHALRWEAARHHKRTLFTDDNLLFSRFISTKVTSPLPRQTAFPSCFPKA